MDILLQIPLPDKKCYYVLEYKLYFHAHYDLDYNRKLSCPG